jgi:hypothetical protein
MNFRASFSSPTQTSSLLSSCSSGQRKVGEVKKAKSSHDTNHLYLDASSFVTKKAFMNHES